MYTEICAHNRFHNQHIHEIYKTIKTWFDKHYLLQSVFKIKLVYSPSHGRKQSWLCFSYSIIVTVMWSNILHCSIYDKIPIKLGWGSQWLMDVIVWSNAKILIYLLRYTVGDLSISSNTLLLMTPWSLCNPVGNRYIHHSGWTWDRIEMCKSLYSLNSAYRPWSVLLHQTTVPCKPFTVPFSVWIVPCKLVILR
jgi:hypothetical protein